jgi:arylsulfatase A-like enzyme
MSSAEPTHADRPNLLVIMTDQQQARLTAAAGFEADTTPAIDRLGREGVRFPAAYTSCPLCTPARVSFLTGRYPSATGVTGNSGRHPGVFVDEFVIPTRDVDAGPHLFELLGEAGYERAIVGKNHAHANSTDFEYARSFHHRSEFHDDKSPEEIAFDEWIDGLNHAMSEEPAPFPVELQLPHRIVDESIRWLGGGDAAAAARGAGAPPAARRAPGIDERPMRRADRPFALWVSFPEPHNPYQAPEPYYSMFDGERYVPPDVGGEAVERLNHRWRAGKEKLDYALRNTDAQAYVRRCRSNYLGMLRLIDDEVGRLLSWLEEAGVRDDTVVVFLSDHGDFAGEYGLIRKGIDLPEALIRIPLSIAGPGIVPRAADDPELGSVFPNIVDVLPTLCDLLGLDLPRGVQGHSLAPLLRGEELDPAPFACAYAEWGRGGPRESEADWERTKARYLRDGFFEGGDFWASGLLRSIRVGGHKLVVDSDGGCALFGLERDPNETEDLARQPGNEATVKRLLQALAAKMMELQESGSRAAWDGR